MKEKEMEKKKYSKLDAIRAIIGELRSVGETNADNECYENLKDLEEILDVLVGEVCEESLKQTRCEYSMNRSGLKAKGIIDYLCEIISDYTIDVNG